VRHNKFFYFARERRMRALARQALEWRERIVSRDPLANLRFAEWLLQSPDHVQVWLELTAFDEEVAQCLGNPAQEAIVAAVSDSPHGVAHDEVSALAGSGSRRKTVWMAASAAAVAAVVAGALIVFRFMEPATELYTTAVGEQRSIALKDGSTVRLNTASSLAVQFSRDARRVHLVAGEALFQVHHDVSRPFDVEADGCGTVRAVGTAFAVRIREAGHCDVLVTEGRVRILDAGGRISSSTGPLTISALEAASIRASSFKTASLSPEVLQRRIAWEHGMLAFQGESLSEVVEEFHRYNNERVVIDDPAIAAMHMGGWYRAIDLRGFVQNLRAFGVEAVSIERPNGLMEFHLRKRAQ